MYTYKIFTLGDQYNILSEVIQQLSNFSEREMFLELLGEYTETKRELKEASIDYYELKNGLIPPDGKKHFDYYFLFDISKIKNNYYGGVIYKKIFELLKDNLFDKSCNSVL